MQFTQKSKEHIDSCRFCWMCHHVCPIGNATGLERNTARARALGLSMVARDAIEYSEDIIYNVYECSLCGGCMTDCVTGWDPVMFTKEARLGAALDGKLPEYILTMLSNLQEKGNIYGVEKENKIPDFGDSETLFFIGEDTRAKGCAKTAAELLKKANVEIDEKRRFEITKENIPSNRGMIFLTKSGYLMIVKSMNDDRAWEVQRQLVNAYFLLENIVEQKKEEEAKKLNKNKKTEQNKKYLN